ncbi:vacuolar protein sorting-associated protein 35B-like [Gossypium australe]|uniref:Vacuolar protein sorting-associated protein 35B-like n=1 Tax=Gossypium australe TaxID=47621 RepID=A0A5B6VPD0_9ROSI|nr:vacuolar protein sorting-associated protein 35B-like [Gossypium australe]
MLLSFDEFDVILSIDWLTLHDVVKRILLKCVGGEMINVDTIKLECPTNIISAMSARELIRKGCDTYLTYILDLRILGSELD